MKQKVLSSHYQFSNLVDMLRSQAESQPHQTALIFLDDGENSEQILTYEQFERKSRAISVYLQSVKANQGRAVLLYPPGIDYITAFFGCLYAGVTAVPAYPPHNHRNTSRIETIVADSQAATVLTTSTKLFQLQSLLKKIDNSQKLRWLATDNISQSLEDDWKPPNIKPDSLAFLQYTSGSTSSPKGVMLSHANLLHNAAATYSYMEHSSDSKVVSWLPTYHDMGLIGSILQPLYGGFPCILMSPVAFLQRPYRWLKAISHYRATTSGGPNFAYELCIQKITPEQKATLDLSSWTVAFNGAEPVRASTLERFADSFGSCGFRLDAFYPCYGLAEATLIVSGKMFKKAQPEIKKFNTKALEEHKIATSANSMRALVSCGKSISDQQIAIVDTNTLTRCVSNAIGEVWVSGPSVGKGYWNRAQETKEIFGAYLTDTGEGPFLRTGDLGFLLDDGELFITGRLKDLIIIRGRNLYTLFKVCFLLNHTQFLSTKEL